MVVIFGVNNLSLRVAEFVSQQSEVLFLTRHRSTVPFSLAVGDFFSHSQLLDELCLPTDCVFVITINPMSSQNSCEGLKATIESFCANLNRNFGEAKIIFISSASVYGTSSTYSVCKFSESATLNPISSYAKTKMIFENSLIEVFGSSNRLLIFRPSNIYGPSKFGFRLKSSLLNALYSNASDEHKLVEIQSRRSVRDFVPVSYCASVIARACAIDSFEGSNRVFNLSSGKGHKVFEWVESLIGNDRVEFGHSASGDVSVLDNELVVGLFNLSPDDFLKDFQDLQTELDQFR